MSRGRLLRLGWDMWLAKRGGRAAIAYRQRQRLAGLIAFARDNSPFYRRLYRVVAASADLHDLPVVTKSDLMENFDDLATDAAATEEAARAFIAREQVGGAFLGRYFLCETSGSTGQPGIFLQDEAAMAVYQAASTFRGYLTWTSLPTLLRSLAGGGRVAVVVATGGHYAGAAWLEHTRRFSPWMSGLVRTRVFSVLTPMAELARQLNGFRPTSLVGYPTALAVLAEEQAAGVLSVSPHLVMTAGEWLSQPARERMAEVFRCPVRDIYAASECLTIALDCGHGWMHVNEDWVVIEAVDEGYRPVPAGQPSKTVLVTNLANRVQPLLRYDLGDSVTVRPDACPCGSPFMALRVEGRQDEILRLAAPGGKTVAVVPMAVAAVVEGTPGVERYQVIQTGRAKLTVRLALRPGADGGEVWTAVERRLKGFLEQHGAPAVEIARGGEEPGRSQKTGKYRQVWTEIEG